MWSDGDGRGEAVTRTTLQHFTVRSCCLLMLITDKQHIVFSSFFALMFPRPCPTYLSCRWLLLSLCAVDSFLAQSFRRGKKTLVPVASVRGEVEEFGEQSPRDPESVVRRARGTPSK